MNCLLALLSLPCVTRAGVVNVDIHASNNDYVHVGADGVLSEGGTFWNVYARRDPITVTDLRDESNTVTSVSIGRSGYPGWYYNNGLPTNSLQFSAIESSQSYQSDYIYVSNLTASAEYDVAVYLSVLPTTLWVNGTWKTSESGYVTGSLPGTEDYDYVLFTNVTPYAGGLIRIYIGRTSAGSHNAVVSGLQVRGPIGGGQSNLAPTDILLSSSSVAENLLVGTTVGALSTTDPDAGDTHTYTLVDGTGDNDNDSFSIGGSNLLTATSFNYESKSNYTVRLRTTDQGSLEYEEALPLSITDVLEPPPEFDTLTLEGGDVVLRWSSIANHTYILHDSTSVPTGFAERATGIVATPPMNTYTGTLGGASSKFWKVTTEE